MNLTRKFQPSNQSETERPQGGQEEKLLKSPKDRPFLSILYDNISGLLDSLSVNSFHVKQNPGCVPFGEPCKSTKLYIEQSDLLSAKSSPQIAVIQILPKKGSAVLPYFSSILGLQVNTHPPYS